jgi:hypothetical protein
MLRSKSLLQSSSLRIFFAKKLQFSPPAINKNFSVKLNISDDRTFTKSSGKFSPKSNKINPKNPSKFNRLPGLDNDLNQGEALSFDRNQNFTADNFGTDETPVTSTQTHKSSDDDLRFKAKQQLESLNTSFDFLIKHNKKVFSKSNMAICYIIINLFLTQLF